MDSTNEIERQVGAVDALGALAAIASTVAKANEDERNEKTSNNASTSATQQSVLPHCDASSSPSVKPTEQQTGKDENKIEENTRKCHQQMQSRNDKTSSCQPTRTPRKPLSGSLSTPPQHQHHAIPENISPPSHPPYPPPYYPYGFYHHHQGNDKNAEPGSVPPPPPPPPTSYNPFHPSQYYYNYAHYYHGAHPPHYYPPPPPYPPNYAMHAASPWYHKDAPASSPQPPSRYPTPERTPSPPSQRELKDVNSSPTSVTAINLSSLQLSQPKSVPDLKRRVSVGKWSEEEDALLRQAVSDFDGKNWKKVALRLNGRTDVQCLHRWQKVLKPGLIKGPWTPEEDATVVRLVSIHGTKSWSLIARTLNGRLGKQCRERWHNHLDPAIKKGEWTEAEDRIITDLYLEMGGKWAIIAKRLPGRTDNSIKNRWNSSLRHHLSESPASRKNRKRKATNDKTSQSKSNHGVEDASKFVGAALGDFASKKKQLRRSTSEPSSNLLPTDVSAPRVYERSISAPIKKNKYDISKYDAGLLLDFNKTSPAVSSISYV